MEKGKILMAAMVNYDILKEIKEKNTTFGMELRRELGVDSSTISRKLGLLTKHGLIEALPQDTTTSRKYCRLTRLGGDFITLVDLFFKLDEELQNRIDGILGDADNNMTLEDATYAVCGSRNDKAIDILICKRAMEMGWQVNPIPGAPIWLIKPK